jgi:RNA polymerase sigma factor (TIGR02999 family)
VSSAVSQEVTRLLRECRDGGPEPVKHLVPLVYEELRGLAERQLRGERPGHTLQPTALVNEAFVKLVGSESQPWESRTHFFRAAGTAMRRILVNHAVAKKAEKRGGDARRLPLDDAVASFEERSLDLIALDEALSRLATFDEEKSRIVELRFFVGLTNDETADVLGVSTRTVERGWRLAKAWLRKEVEKE